MSTYMNLPRPSANRVEYDRIMKEGFQKYPKRYENYNKYLAMINSGYPEIVPCMPIKMDYEVSSICNFRCRMCLMRDTFDKRFKQMSFTEYKKSLDEQYGLIEVKLQGIGEPLLNKEFFLMVRETVKRNIWVRTTTNGSLLHVDNNYKKMIDEKVGEIQVSIDGATKKTFEYIRTGSNFEQVVENVKQMNSYAWEKGEEWRSSCWILLQKDNFDEMKEFLELAKYMKFTRVVFSLAVSDWGGVRTWNFVNSKKSVHDIFTADMAKELIDLGKERGLNVTFWDDSTKYVYSSDKDKLCEWIFSRAYISGDMQIVPCCTISDPDTMQMGDANEFSNSWNSEDYVEFRRQHLIGNIPDVCKKCYCNEVE